MPGPYLNRDNVVCFDVARDLIPHAARISVPHVERKRAGAGKPEAPGMIHTTITGWNGKPGDSPGKAYGG
jgi:hypothetical protein